MAARRSSSTARAYDLVVGAVAHDEYRALADDRAAQPGRAGGTLADLKGMWRDRTLDRRSTDGL